ncbi:MAG: YhcN/YlaJ family sporulation lipoprotein [Syntrophomonadaceae bacterium]|nr:YhcN/YlaJ family sporulation lipoprotein [Syntrophomonadaceae bacterium]
MKRKTFLLLSLCLSLFLLINGCSNTAAKKPITPTPQKQTTQNGQLTESERRVMASKLSKMAEEVDGVKKATVVVADLGLSSNNGITTPVPGPNTSNKGISTNPTPGNMEDAPLPNQNTTSTGQTKNITTNDDVWLGNDNQASGMIIMVGLTLDSANQDKATAIQTQVRNKLKASDKRISQVLVSTDPNMIKRINDVAAGIIQGKPIKTFQKDINELNTKFKEQQPTI